MEKIFFKSGREILAGLISSNKTKPDLFFFHGGGLKKEKEKFKYMMRDLAKQGVNSLAFDFSGVNESSGSFNDSSLEKRVSEAKSVIENFYTKNQPINVCGFSMGGYVAIKMTKIFKVKNLMLFCPAVYAKKAYRLNFGEQFSKILREEKSWKKSDAWGLLKKFKNNLIMFVPENDEVVPREVSDFIYSSAKNCRLKKEIILPNFTHKVHSIIPKKRKIRREIIAEITKSIK